MRRKRTLVSEASQKKTDIFQQVSFDKNRIDSFESKKLKVSNHNFKKILQNYQELSDEPDISEEGIEELFRALDKFILPMNIDSAFFDTDLIIIDDAFSGNMPLNGIKKSELENVEQLFKKICDGKEKIKIITTDVNDPFKHETENLFKKLLTRNIGRKLIRKVIENSSLPKLEILSGKKGEYLFEELKMFLSIDNPVVVSSHPTGKLKCQILPHFISLAHELVHTTHTENVSYGRRPASFSDKYDNNEEQLTITGLHQDFSLEKKYNEDESWEMSGSDLEYFKNNYDELNEWNITAAFTDSQNVYYPRFGHRGACLTRSFPLKNSEIDKIKEFLIKGDEVELKSLREDIRSLVNTGLLYDLEEFDKLNIIDLLKLFEDNLPLKTSFFEKISSAVEGFFEIFSKAENASPPLIFSAVLSGEVGMIQFLIDKGFDLNAINSKGENVLHRLFISCNESNLQQYSDVIKLLLKNGVSISQSDNEGLTPLHKLFAHNEIGELKFGEGKPLMELILTNALANFNLESLFKVYPNRGKYRDFCEYVYFHAFGFIEQFLTENHSKFDRLALNEYYKKLPSILNEVHSSLSTFDLNNLLIELQR